jgi:hypothetical protein
MSDVWLELAEKQDAQALVLLVKQRHAAPQKPKQQELKPREIKREA